MINTAINQTVDVFCETVSLKLNLFHKLFPKGQHNHLTGLFVEELVKSFIADWIHPYCLVSGSLLPWDACPDETLKSHGMSTSIKTPKQLDGIIYDRTLGPCIFQEGNFTVVHPAFCRGIIEIKKSNPRLPKSPLNNR